MPRGYEIIDRNRPLGDILSELLSIHAEVVADSQISSSDGFTEWTASVPSASHGTRSVPATLFVDSFLLTDQCRLEPVALSPLSLPQGLAGTLR